MINTTQNTDASEACTVTRPQVVKAMQTLFNGDEIGFHPLNANTVTDIIDIDSGEYRRSIQFCGYQFLTKAARLYYNMLARCSSGKPAYINCFVSEEWLDSFESFSNFCRSEIGYFQRDENGVWFEMDSDLLSNGVKQYGKNTVTFLPQIINSTLSASGSKGCYKSPSGKWYTTICKYGKHIHLGTYPTEKQARAAYRKARRAYIRELAKKYRHQISINAYSALMAYKQL